MKMKVLIICALFVVVSSEKELTGSDEKWFCAVSKAKGVLATTTELRSAQRALGPGKWGKSQAIIPMTGRVAGDPHTLTKDWGNGSMWWWNWPDIKEMQATCERAKRSHGCVKKEEFYQNIS